MKVYNHLTQRQRFIIQDLFELGKSFSEIAKEVGVHRTTIAREIKRNSNQKGGYRALGATSSAQMRKRIAEDYRRKIKGALEELILEKLNQAWSPEQISGRLKVEGSFSISHEAIYRWIYQHAPECKKALRIVSRRRQGRKGRRQKRIFHNLKNRKSIEARSEAANERLRLGDWERDLLLGKRSGPALLVLVDRKSRLTRVARVYGSTQDEVGSATKNILSQERHKKSITNDNGLEFLNAEALEKDLSVPVYYTHPYSSWERGTVENTNGLLRQFYPKGFDLWKTNQEELKAVEENLNTRPRKSHQFRTPTEIHFDKKQKLIKSESTYERQRSDRLLEDENNFWREFYLGEMRALTC